MSMTINRGYISVPETRGILSIPVPIHLTTVPLRHVRITVSAHHVANKVHGKLAMAGRRSMSPELMVIPSIPRLGIRSWSGALPGHIVRTNPLHLAEPHGRWAVRMFVGIRII